MRNIRIGLHIVLLCCFSLPWLKIPLFITTVSMNGYLLPFRTNMLAKELNDLGVMAISFDRLLPIYLMLLAPALSCFVLIRIFTSKQPSLFFDSVTGFIAVMSCLYILTNAGDIITFGLYAAIICSLLLVASPLFNKDKTVTFNKMKHTA